MPRCRRPSTSDRRRAPEVMTMAARCLRMGEMDVARGGRDARRACVAAWTSRSRPDASTAADAMSPHSAWRLALPQLAAAVARGQRRSRSRPRGRCRLGSPRRFVASARPESTWRLACLPADGCGAMDRAPGRMWVRLAGPALREERGRAALPFPAADRPCETGTARSGRLGSAHTGERIHAGSPGRAAPSDPAPSLTRMRATWRQPAIRAERSDDGRASHSTLQ